MDSPKSRLLHSLGEVLHHVPRRIVPVGPGRAAGRAAFRLGPAVAVGHSQAIELLQRVALLRGCNVKTQMRPWNQPAHGKPLGLTRSFSQDQILAVFPTHRGWAFAGDRIATAPEEEYRKFKRPFPPAACTHPVPPCRPPAGARAWGRPARPALHPLESAPPGRARGSPRHREPTPSRARAPAAGQHRRPQAGCRYWSSRRAGRLLRGPAGAARSKAERGLDRRRRMG
jgi:hypothetical protein